MGRKRKGDMSPKKVRVSYTLSPDLVVRMEEFAGLNSRSASSVFEEAVEKFLIPLQKPRLLRRQTYGGSATPHEVSPD
jgi:hypothetical protein